MYLEIVFLHSFDPNIFDDCNCRVDGNKVTSRGTMDEINTILAVSDTVFGDRTIIMRRSQNEKREET